MYVHILYVSIRLSDTNNVHWIQQSTPSYMLRPLTRYYRSDERVGIVHIISVVKRVELVISKPLQWLKVVLGPRSLPSDGIIPLLFSWKCVLVRPDKPKEYE